MTSKGVVSTHIVLVTYEHTVKIPVVFSSCDLVSEFLYHVCDSLVPASPRGEVCRTIFEQYIPEECALQMDVSGLIVWCMYMCIFRCIYMYLCIYQFIYS